MKMGYHPPPLSWLCWVLKKKYHAKSRSFQFYMAMCFCYLVNVTWVWLRIRSTQKPQYSKTGVLKNPHVREICDFFAEIYNYQGTTRVFETAVFEYCGFWVLRILSTVPMDCSLHLFTRYKNSTTMLIWSGCRRV